MLTMSKQIVNQQSGKADSEAHEETTHVRIDKGLHARAKALAKRSPHVSLAFVIDQALRDFLDYYGDDGVVEFDLRKRGGA